MAKYSKRDLLNMLNEEVELHNNRKIWEEEVKPVLSLARNRLVKKGLPENRIDEDFARAMFNNLLKLGGAGTADIAGIGGSESLFGGLGGGIQTAIEQSAIEKVVELIGLDPYKGFGNILKNAIEQSIKQLTQDELMSLVSANKAECMPIAEKLASIVLASIEESAKEQLLSMLMDVIIGELGDDFRKNAFTKPIYQNIREKFSDAFEKVLSDPAVHKDLSIVICDNINIKSLLGNKVDDVAGVISDTWSTATAQLGTGGFNFGNEY